MEIQQKEKESLAATYIYLNVKLTDAISIMMLQRLGYSQKGLGMHTLWHQGFMRKDYKAKQMPLRK